MFWLPGLGPTKCFHVTILYYSIILDIAPHCFLRFPIARKQGAFRRGRMPAPGKFLPRLRGRAIWMYSKILFIIIASVLLAVAVLVIFLWDKISEKQLDTSEGNGRPEGAFRAFYHMLWILILWSGLGLSLPLWFSYKEKIAGLPMPERWIFIGKIIVFPLILLALLGYGARQGYLKWIESLDWPDKENG